MTLDVDNESSCGFLREFHDQGAAVNYARVLAHTLDPEGIESKVWINQIS